MPYSEFTYETAKSRLGLTTCEDATAFAFPPIIPSATLLELLAVTLPMALAVSTEKARSEMVIFPILLEARRLAGRPVSLFSGTDFSVDPSRGLSGVCDFILSQSPDQFAVEAPVIAVVEAKRDDMKSGLGQCLAEMVGAQQFNETKGRDPATVYGVVTTGSNWRFLSLENDLVRFDPAERFVSELGHVLGNLIGMVSGVGLRSLD